MKTAGYLKRTLVFIASPGDILLERQFFPEIIERVNKVKAKEKGILLEPVGWEDTLPGKGRPQEKINEDLRKSDLIVMLLWKRWGSYTGKYSSGFEEEYEIAKEGNKDIWFYFRSIPDAMLADPGEQLKKVLEFRNKVEIEKKYLFRAYEDEINWKELFFDDLCQWLDGVSLISKDFEKIIAESPQFKQLECELNEMKSKQWETAQSLADQAKKLADSGQFTLAEEIFARAISISPDPSIITQKRRVTP